MTSEVLLKALEDLGDEEFKRFKWYLQQRDILEGYQPIQVSKLEKADRQDTVNLMGSTFTLDGALTVTKKVLTKMNKNDLVQSVRRQLGTRRVDHSGEQRLRPGLRRYACELTLDTNTANRCLELSHNKKVTYVTDEQPYPDHPERFDFWPQLICTKGLTGRCYWEVEWEGNAFIAVTYRGIKRKGGSGASCFGENNQSWSLNCYKAGGLSVRHNDIETNIASSSSSSFSSSSFSVSNRVGVYVDWPAGTLSFYSVSSDTLIHLHTFSTTFTEPLYPGFGFGRPGYSVTLCSL